MFRRFLTWWVPHFYEKHSIDLWGFCHPTPGNAWCTLYSERNHGLFPLTFPLRQKTIVCTQGPVTKWESQEIGACTPKQQVIFDLVLCNQINEDKLWFWWIDSFRCICIDQTVMHPDDAADARSFLQKRTSYPPPFYFPPKLIKEYQNDTNLVLPDYFFRLWYSELSVI